MCFCSRNEGGSNIRKTNVSDVSGGNTDKPVSGKGGVNDTSIITIADSNDTALSTASKNAATNAMDNVNRVGASHFASKNVSNVESAAVASGSRFFQKTVDNSNATSAANDDIIEIVAAAAVGEEVFESGISIEDDEDETDNRGAPPLAPDMGSSGPDVSGGTTEQVAAKEMESEIVILELSDEAEPGAEDSTSVSKGQHKSATAAAATNRSSLISASDTLGQQVMKQGDANVTVKKKFVPITGPSPPQSKSANANASSSTSQITVNNSKKRPIRSIPNRQVPDKSLSDITSASGASNVMSKNRGALGAKVDDSLSRAVAQPHRLVTAAAAGPRNPAVFQHAVSVAGFGMPLNTNQMNSAAANARVVRVLADPYPNTAQQLEHEAAKR